MSYKAITTNQELILLIIEANPGKHSGEIVELLNQKIPAQWRTFKKGSISNTIDGLDQAGLISRVEKESHTSIAKNTKQPTKACFIAPAGTEALAEIVRLRAALRG